MAMKPTAMEPRAVMTYVITVFVLLFFVYRRNMDVAEQSKDAAAVLQR